MSTNLDATLAKYQKMCDGSNQLMEILQQSSIIEGLKVINNAMTHMVVVIRWSQMELALLRTLEDITRNNLKYEDQLDYEPLQKVVLRLDDLREELRKQQEGELENLEHPKSGGSNETEH